MAEREIIKKETLRHQEALDYYYVLGPKRSHKAVAKRFKVGSRAVDRWAASFNWTKRVEQRDIENKKKSKEKTDRIVLNSMADYRKELKQFNAIVSNEIRQIFRKVIDPDGKEHLQLKIVPTNITDVTKLLTIKDKLIRLDMDLMENPLGNAEGPVKLIVGKEYLPETEEKEEKPSKE